VVASLGVFVTGLLVLPSLAGDDLRYKLADILKVLFLSLSPRWQPD